MTSPLVTRPPYGESRSALPRAAESKLPGGGPSDKGLPLDSAIPGTSTYNKPEDDIREPRKDDESIHRVDDANDLLKDRDRVDTREDNADKHDGIGGMGKGKWDTTVKTKYPYRDDKPNKHWASAEAVKELFLLDYAPSRVFLPGAKVAATIDEIERGLSPRVVERAATCSVALKRADIPHLRWILSVDCGNGPRMVKVKASRVGKIVQVAKMDLEMSCSCPGWRWLGPEHHSQREDYLDGRPRGTASVPVIRDPEMVNRVCKHVAAALSKVRTWQIPMRGKR